MNSIDFIRSIISNRPWEPKQSSINKLVQGYIRNSKDDVEDIDMFKKDLTDAFNELQWKGELKILAGLGWAANGDVEFIFQANIMV